MILCEGFQPSQSAVSFPSSSHLRPTHLPFRRISLPTPQRRSVASITSFDSLPEEGDEPANASSSGTHLTPNARQHKSSLTSSSVSVLPPSPTRLRRRSIESPQNRRGRKTKLSSEAVDAATAKLVREAREQKGRKIIREFFDTEKTYVNGLDFIYHHFLSPLIASLETSEPLLDRAALTNLFSNFIDIWNLHKAFFEALTGYLSPPPSADHSNANTATASQLLALSPILLSHFPYLSLYNPFITAFPSILSTLASLTSPPSFSHPNPNYSKPFSEFLAKQESHPKCGKLKFRDWMLTIVQRCPRYLLLLKDLRACMDPNEDEEGEYEKLGRVLDLVSRITSSLNASLQIHAETLSLISLQRSTTNLPLSPPFQFVLPGRKLLKRGSLYQIERSEPAREREFLLFSDCLVWLARKWSSSGELEEWGGRISSRIIGSSESVADASAKPVYGNRNRSMSDAHLPLPSTLAAWRNDGGGLRSTPSSPRGMKFSLLSRASQVSVPALAAKPKRHSMAGMPSTASGGNGANSEERWVYKGRLDLVDVEVVVSSEWGGEQRRFEVLSPEGSFALYAATEHDRDEWISTIRQAKAQLLVSLNVTNPNSTLTSSASTHHVRRSLQALPFPPVASSVPLVDSQSQDRTKVESGRRKVEHWVPAIWIPDEKTRECMRCGQTFGWRRRRHHCRLCGRCVCAGCSEKTFYITDAGDTESSSKPARACNVCYETVFPVLDSEPELNQNDSNDEAKSHNWDTITSLSNFSAWVSTPSFAVQTSSTDSVPSSPRALMGMNFERTPGSRLGEHPLVDGRKGRVRLRSLDGKGPKPRPLSSSHLLDGFCEESQGQLLNSPMPRGIDEPHQQGRLASANHVESTVKRKKRFSLPALALQPLNVTARTAPRALSNGTTEGSSLSAHGPKEKERTRRFSLVPGGRNQSRSSLSLAPGEGGDDTGSGVGEKSIVITKLSELLKGSSSRAGTR